MPNPKGPRILAFSPYAGFRIHTNYETTILRGCQVRGADVRAILCDGAFAECDMHSITVSGHPRPLNMCRNCSSEARADFAKAGIPVQWVKEFVYPTERQEIFDWAQALRPDQFMAANYRGFPVTECIATAVVSQFRQFPIDLSDWQSVNTFRGYLQAGATTYVALSRALKELAPDAIVLFNGRLSVLKVAVTLAKQFGIRVLVHESRRLPGSLTVFENQTCACPDQFNRIWREWSDVPLNTAQLERCMSWVRDRRFRLDKNLYHFASIPSGSRDILRSLGLAGFQKVAVLFTSSTDEISGDPEIKEPYASHEDWVELVVAWMAKHPAHGLVIRVHPCLTGKTAGTARSAFLIEWYHQLAKRLPANVRMVAADDPLSSYDLMDAADLGISYGSTAGIEMLLLGKPVAAVPDLAFYGRAPGVVRLDDPSTLASQLDRLFTLGPSREVRRMAFRCLHRQMFDMEVPFGLVTLTDGFTSQCNYASNEELVPGCDPGLDRLCDFLLRGMPIFPPPSALDRAITIEDEDRFFARLEADSSWLTKPPVAARSSRQKEAAVSMPWHLGRKLLHAIGVLIQGPGESDWTRTGGSPSIAADPASDSVAQARLELQQARAIIAAMESSKFWKLRKLCGRLRRGIRMVLGLVRVYRGG